MSGHYGLYGDFSLFLFAQNLQFLALCVTNGLLSQLPKDVRQLKPSLLLDKNNEKGFETERIRRLGTFFRVL
jgi:hypothetical protein